MDVGDLVDILKFYFLTINSYFVCKCLVSSSFLIFKMQTKRLIKERVGGISYSYANENILMY